MLATGQLRIHVAGGITPAHESRSFMVSDDGFQVKNVFLIFRYEPFIVVTRAATVVIGIKSIAEINRPADRWLDTANDRFLIAITVQVEE